MAKPELRADIAAAKSRMRVTAGGNREMKHLEGYLWEGELVEDMTTGTYGVGVGLLVLTTRRVLFIAHGLTRHTSEDFPFDRISSVHWHEGPLTGTLTISAMGVRAAISNMNKQTGKTIADAIRARLLPEAAAAQDRETQDDVYKQLEKLGQLKAAGVLSEGEFEAKKAVLLSRI